MVLSAMIEIASAAAGGLAMTVLLSLLAQASFDF
jgi:hypothetical protein